jgi:hypothetical protein
MTAWSQNELKKIAATDDLHISPFRDDGITYGTLTWIWSVVVEGALYVRAYHGRESRWFQAAAKQEAGRITAGGLTKEVTFETIDGPINDAIDNAYRAKCRDSPYLKSMISPQTRAATVRISPRETDNTCHTQEEKT